MKRPVVAVCGANPSWQKTLFFDKLIPGKVNRAKKEENYPSGKGVNFCRALRCSGLADLRLIQFAGGINGQRLCAGLDAAGYIHETVVTSAETRSCITCLDQNGNMTELIGASIQILPDEENDFFQKLQKLLSQADILAITGSLPDGSNPDIYQQAAKLAVEKDIPLLFDTLIGIDDIFRLPGKSILKVNREEFFKITGENEIISAHRCAASRYPGKVFAVTNGGESATLANDDFLWEYTLPSINVVSPLGAGDTASAVMSALYAAGVSEKDAFLQALAAASANCLTPMAGEFDTANADMIAGQIKTSQSKL